MQLNNLVISDRILILSFDSQSDMNAALARFADWRQNSDYVTAKKPVGHSIGCGVITDMRAAKFAFNRQEKVILKLYDKHILSKKPGIIIGCVRYDKDVILHELAHAAFYLFTPYRKKCQKILRSLPETDRDLINALLEKDGYDRDVWEDETHAYLLESPNNLITEIKMKHAREFKKRWLKVSKELQEVFTYYMGQFIPLNILE